MSGKKGRPNPKKLLKSSNLKDLDPDVTNDIKCSAIDYAEDIKMFHEYIFNRLVGDPNMGTSDPINGKSDPKKQALSKEGTQPSILSMRNVGVGVNETQAGPDAGPMNAIKGRIKHVSSVRGENTFDHKSFWNTLTENLTKVADMSTVEEKKSIGDRIQAFSARNYVAQETLRLGGI